MLRLLARMLPRELTSTWVIMAVAMALTAAIGMSVITLLDVRRARAEFRSQTTERALLLARSLSEVVADSLYYGDVDGLRDISDGIRGQPGLAFIQIYNSDGRILVAPDHTRYAVGTISDQFALSALADTSPVIRFDGDFLEVAAPVLAGDQILGGLHLGFDDEALHEAIAAMTAVRAWQAAVLIAVSVAISTLLARRMTRPIRRLAEAARSVAAGDWSARVAPAGPREIRSLTEAFNEMAVRVEESHRHLQDHSEILEREVNDRTRELRTLAEIGRTFSSSLHIDQVFQPFAEKVGEVIPHDFVSLAALNSARDTLVGQAASGIDVDGILEGDTLPLTRPAVHEATRSRRAIVVTDRDVARGLLGFPGGKGSRDRPAPASALLVPLISSGSVIGLLTFVSRERHAYSDRHRELADRIGAQIAGALTNARLHVELIQVGKEREQRLDRERRELQKRNDGKSQFFATASHELKSPLAASLAFTDLLLRNREGTLSERQMKQLEIVARNGRHLEMLINDLVDLGHIEAGTLTLEIGPIDARELLLEIVESYAPVLAQKNQRLTADIPRHRLPVIGDRSRLNQVLSNLISNASKYSPEGREIVLTSGIVDSAWHVEVTDQGIGIPDADLQHLFTPFHRAENARRGPVTGSGLGLFIAHTIVGLHGGEIGVESKLDSGTTVRVILPVAAAQQEAA